MPHSLSSKAQEPALLPVDWPLLPAEEKILVAVSGGADSMALLLVLVQAGRELVVAHVNHGLRGAESDADQAFVAAHCVSLRLPYVSERVTVACRNGHANEAAARQARYESLIRQARLHSCSRIATGHTASDLLETVLMNWLRGAAIGGLSGIPPQRPLTKDILLVRPLLQATREQTRAACRQANWGWREDLSNQDPKYLRNRVRHELLPVLEHLMAGGGSIERLAQQTSRASTVLREELAYLDQVAQDHLAALTLCREEQLIALDGLRFRELPPVLQRRVLRCGVQQLQGQVRDVSLEAVEKVRCHVMAKGRRKVWQWRHGMNIEWTGEMAGNRIRLWLVSDKG
ncbi:MAG: tRNA lysidine(34) synthetase TilS [Abitibacteriaceae bacterium]|nr:tRNA lysidine(34) synthetase TilS [Abditibacteriaceae bacterium]MBV9868088.1 tRNA lysidine(34) synthetase TilS [Abditibacteriaceae bacterium]